LPAVYDIPYQIEIIGLVMFEKIEKKPGLAATHSEVDIGNPDRAVLFSSGVGHRRLFLWA
jgi:hypothetical protein